MGDNSFFDTLHPLNLFASTQNEVSHITLPTSNEYNKCNYKNAQPSIRNKIVTGNII